MITSWQRTQIILFRYSLQFWDIQDKQKERALIFNRICLLFELRWLHVAIIAVYIHEFITGVTLLEQVWNLKKRPNFILCEEIL